MVDEYESGAGGPFPKLDQRKKIYLRRIFNEGNIKAGYLTKILEGTEKSWIPDPEHYYDNVHLFYTVERIQPLFKKNTEILKISRYSPEERAGGPSGVLKVKINPDGSYMIKKFTGVKQKLNVT